MLQIGVSQTKKKRRKSAVWHFFSADPGQKAAVCTLCNEIVRTSGNTTNLFNHLKKAHKTSYDEVEMMQATEQIGSPKIRKTPKTIIKAEIKAPEIETPKIKNAKRNQKLTNSLVNMIAIDMAPSSMVDDIGFKNFVKVLDNSYEMPTSYHLIDDLLPTKYEAVKNKLQSALSKASFVALSTDVWTCGKPETFLTIYCHFIDSEWRMKSYVLETRKSEQACRADDLALCLKEVAQSWKLSNKISCMVSRSAEDVKEAAEIATWTHFSCFSQVLDAALDETLLADEEVGSIRHLLIKCKDIAAILETNSKAESILTQQQRAFQLPETKITFGYDKWDSIYHMFERIVEHQLAINGTIDHFDQASKIMPEELEVMADIVTVLKPFDVAVRELLKEKFTSVSKVLPLARSLLKKVSGSSSYYARRLQHNLLKRLKKLYGQVETNTILSSSSILDPRFKQLPFSEKKFSDETISKLQQEISAIESPSVRVEIIEQSMEEDCDALWDFFDQSRTQAENAKSSNEYEIRQYFQDKLINRMENPLEWWKSNEKRFEKLSWLAKKYLSIPASAIPPSRIYTEAGKTVASKRSIIPTDRVNMRVFLYENSDLL